MRLWSLALSLVLATCAGAAFAAEEYFPLPEDEAAPIVTVKGSLWLTDGRTEVSSHSITGNFDNDRNLMALIDGELQMPGAHWVSVWGRAGASLLDGDGDFEGEDSEADFQLFELNLGLSIAGRGSPLAPKHALPRTHSEVYVGVLAFKESFDADQAGGGSTTYDTTWVAPKVGLRGYWRLDDTYFSDAARGWGLEGGFALIPWATVSANSDVDGGRSADQDSDGGYGYTWNLGVSYRAELVSVGLGYESLLLRTDKGDEDFSGGGSGDLFKLESKRRGFVVGVGVEF